MTRSGTGLLDSIGIEFMSIAFITNRLMVRQTFEDGHYYICRNGREVPISVRKRRSRTDIFRHGKSAADVRIKLAACINMSGEAVRLSRRFLSAI